MLKRFKLKKRGYFLGISFLFPKEKKAEKVFSVWWFLVLALVAGGIVAGVFISTSAGVDVREAESLSLYNRLAECLINNGEVIDGFFDEGFDIFDKCGLEKEAINSPDFYFKVNLLNEEGNSMKNLQGGTPAFEEDCRIGRSVVAKNFPKCTEGKEKVFYYSADEKKSAMLLILTASNQKGRRIS